MEMLCGKGHSRAHHVKGAEFFAGLFISFVAALGSMSIYGNIWMYRFYKVVFAVGFLSFILIRKK